MPSFLQPYLFFNGRCEEALQFYQSALGAELGLMMRFSESPDAPPPGTVPSDWAQKIMHAEFTIGSTTVFASDGCETVGGFSGFSLSLAPPSADEADRIFAALAEGGNVTMPLGPTFWSPRFGTLTDKFGLGWMINVAPAADHGT